MDTKKVIEKLVKIAAQQQQIINKLAQIQAPPTRLEPTTPELHPGKLVEDSLPLAFRGCCKIDARGDTLYVSFAPGKASQAALNAITTAVQNLLRQNKLPFAYKVQQA